MAENQNQAPAKQSLATGFEVKYNTAGKELTLNASIVRNYLVKGNGDITDVDIINFISLCKYKELNPFLNEAYLTSYKTKDGGHTTQIIESLQSYIKRAEANEHYKGYKAGVIVVRNNTVVYEDGAFWLPTDTLVGGWAEVYRDDRQVPFKISVPLKDYDKNQSTWTQIKSTMIRKVALAQCLRESFPTQIGATYIQEEVRVEDVDYEDVTKTAGKANVNPLPPEEPATLTAPAEPTPAAPQTSQEQKKAPVQTEIPDAFK